MRGFLLDEMENGEHGLFVYELPTGYGKTYITANCMKEYADNPRNSRKIIYLTTMNKNLPEDALRAAYGDDKAYERDVLRIRSNFDEVTENLLNVVVPEEFQSAYYQELCKWVGRYLSAKNQKINDKLFIDDLIQKIHSAESHFRTEISRRIKAAFATKEMRINAIRTNPGYKWIGVLYPAVFTDSHKILLMSISKFMKRNSVIVEPSYEFLKSDLIRNAIIFIDEFDATKKTIQGEIIKKSLAMKEDYIALFRQLYRTLNPDDLSEDMRTAFRKISEGAAFSYSFENIVEEAEQITNQYSTNLSYKTAEGSIDRKQNFLLKDGSFHSMLRNGAQYIRTVKNTEENKVEIFFEKKGEFFKNRKDSDIVIYSLLRDINNFLFHFRLFLFEWAGNYMTIINGKRKPEADMMTIDNATSTILRRLELNDKQRNLLLGELCKTKVRERQDDLLPDNSFYQKGMEFFEFEDHDAHNDNTNLRFVEVYDTPEKILLYLTEMGTVFGVSATAEIPTVVGNYDLGYVAEKLGDAYHRIAPDSKERISDGLEENWEAYRTGKIRIHTEVVSNTLTAYDTERVCKEIIMDSDIAMICANHINDITENEYYGMRYCNILKAMRAFCENGNIQSMLYLGMALPKKNNPEMNEDTLHELMGLAIQDTGAVLEEDQVLAILRGDNFEEEKEKLLERLGQGEKIFIMSSYNTIGAGQNLQYKVTDKRGYVELTPYQNDGDQRHFSKDIDAIYLGDVTNLTINTYKDGRLSAEGLMEMLFQIEELYQNAELNYAEAEDMIKLAFCSYTGSGDYQSNLLYKTKSVRMQATQQVLQAVGRMCRTFIKSPEIYIYIEKGLLEKLDAGELRKRILPPEMESIAALREQLGAEYSFDEERIMKMAEKISSYGMWNIRQFLSRNWTERSMKLWEELRHDVLTYPTADGKDREGNSNIRKLYITSGVSQNRYFFSQYSDFRDVTVDFGTDLIAFRNSGRAKRKGESDEVAVFEMTEANSGLPIVLKYPGMRAHFRENEFATSFEEKEYMMSPVLFNNIYKGALGEVAGAFILQRERGIRLQPITEADKFEFFDFVMAADVYVDFKNWKFTYLQDREKIKNEILRKLDVIGGKRVYIINIIADGDYIPTSQIDERIIEIPCLIDSNGNVVRKSLNMIKEEDFE